jgi:hypothetical protein
LANAQHIKDGPGRKTDQKDAEGIAQLLQYGLLRPSSVPGEVIRDLRDLTRMRASLALATRTVENKAFAFIFLSGRGFESNLATLSLSRFSRGTVRLFSYQAVFCTRLLAFTLPMPVAMSQPGVAPNAG